MERKYVNALLSDYDGTLCPTTSVRGDSSSSKGMIPNELEQALVQLSERKPLRDKQCSVIIFKITIV